jgi:hypothetical protein
MEADRSMLMHIGYRKFVVVSILLLLFVITLAISAPAALISKFHKLESGPTTWIGTIQELSAYNQQIAINLKLCSKESVFVSGKIEGFISTSVLEPGEVSKVEINKKLKCEETTLLKIWINYTKYFIQLSIISDSEGELSLNFANPDYITYKIVFKGLAFEVLLFSTVLARNVHIRLIKTSRSMNSITIMILSVFCVFSFFPYQLLGLQWSQNQFFYLEMCFRALVLLCLLAYLKLSQKLGDLKSNIVFFSLLSFYLAIILFSDSLFWLSIVTLGILAGAFIKIYASSIMEYLILKTENKIKLIIDLVVLVFTLLGLQCGVFAWTPSYSELEILGYYMLVSYILYLQWGIRVKTEPVENGANPLLPAAYHESELTSLN